EVTRVPSAYLAKVLQSLARAGLVHSQRGLHGGFTLARSPDDLTIWDVVQAVEPLQRIRECPLGLASHRVRPCPLHQRLADAPATVERAFRATTLAEVLAEPTTNRPLCAFPHIGVPAPHAGSTGRLPSATLRAALGPRFCPPGSPLWNGMAFAFAIKG